MPCPVGRVGYLHPDLLEADLRRTLRSLRHEAFALAVLLFELLMAGFHPYAHRGGGSPLDNQRKALFPYRPWRAGHPQAPQGAYGPAARMWSHLPTPLQETFARTFQGGEPPAPSTWRPLLEAYLQGLEEGEFCPELLPVLSPRRWLRSAA